MIFYKNLKRKRNTQQKNLVYSIFSDGETSNVDESLVKANQCKRSYNFSYKDGTLKTGLGIGDLKVPATEADLQTLHTFDFSQIEEIKNIIFNKWYNVNTGKYYYQLLIIDENFKIRMLPMIDEYNGYVWVRENRLEEEPSFICDYRLNGLESTIYFTTTGALALSYAQSIIYPNIPAMISCVVHYDKFFGITKANRNKLVYTTHTELNEWTASEQQSVVEFLDNSGLFTKLVTFNDYVYLFRENGITKISLYSSNDSFSCTHLYFSPSKIFEQSVCVCGDKIYFATRDGVYTFNGNSVAKVLGQYDVYFKNLNNENCSSACLDGKYYLATKCNFFDNQQVGCESGTYTNNVLFEIDINSGKMDMLRGVDIKKLVSVTCPFANKVVAIFNNTNANKVGEISHDGQVFGQATQKVWESFSTDFGFYNQRKKIKEVILTATNDCKISIESDEENKIFDVFGAENVQRMQINVSGKSFKVTFLTNSQTNKISKPKLVFDVVS